MSTTKSHKKRNISVSPQSAHTPPTRSLASALPFTATSSADMPVSMDQATRFRHSLANLTIHRPDSDTAQTTSEEKPASPVPVQRTALPAISEANNTGLPDSLKSGIERLSGFSLDDVQVHYNSTRPAEVRALAYTQGSEIHMGPGQEQHLAHEAWHVVQQKQGRVQPTLQMKGVAINDDRGLEHEADVMGEKAIGAQQTVPLPLGLAQTSVVQRLNGATPTNFRVTNVSADNAKCSVKTDIDWDSSNANRSDLSDIVSREEVTFSQDPRINVPGYATLLVSDSQFQLAGNVLTKAVGPMSNPGGSDQHSGAGYGTAFTLNNGVPNLQKGNWTLTGTQYYQYKIGPGGVWTNLNALPFIITRTMQLVGDHYELTIQKQGPGGVNVTAGPTRINFETTEAMNAVGLTRPDQTANWTAALGAFTRQGLALSNLAIDHKALNGTGVTFEYNYTRTTPATDPNFVSYLDIDDDWKDTILARARSAVDTVIEQALTGPNPPPTRFKITIFRASGVQQQAFWTNEAGGTYRVLLRADKLMDLREIENDVHTTIPGRESRRGWTQEGKKERFAEAVIVHELGHMLHAFTSPNRYMMATLMPAVIPTITNAVPPDPLGPEKIHIARINGQVIQAIVAKNYKTKWQYAQGNPAEVVAEVFTALMHGRNVPKGLAAVYVAYGGIRSAAIDLGLQKSFGGLIPTISQPEGAIPIINQP